MRDKLFTICAELTERNIKPTLENVRKELGGGSFSTINPILKEWKESQISKPKPCHTAPAEAEKAIEQATALVWRLATEHHAETITAIQAETNRIEQAAITERDEALAEIQTLEEKIKQLESKVAEMESTNTALNAENKEKNNVIAELQHQAEKQQIRLDNALKTAEKAEQQANALREQNASQAEQINALKLEIEKQRLTTESTANTMERQAAEIEQLKTEAKSQAKEINSLSLQNQKLQTALDSSNKATEKATQEAKESRQKAEQAQNEAAKLAGILEGYKLSTTKTIQS